MNIEQIIEEINWCNDNHKSLTVFISDDGHYDHSLTNFQIVELDEFGEGFEYLNVTVGTIEASAILQRIEELEMEFYINNKIPK